MKITFFGKSKYSLRFCEYLMNLNIEIHGIYDISLQSAVEMAAYTDSKAFVNIDEAVKDTDVIIISDDKELNTYLKYIHKAEVENKIICLLSTKNTSDKIFTNELNTHLSIYSPILTGKNKSKETNTEFIVEGFGIRYTQFTDYLSKIKIPFSTISVDEAKSFYAMINLFTNGIETLTKMMNNALSDSKVDLSHLTKQLILALTEAETDQGTFYTYDTHSIIKTLDLLKSKASPAPLSLYKILALNAIEYTDYTKRENEHIKNIILDTKNDV